MNISSDHEEIHAPEIKNQMNLSQIIHSKIPFVNSVEDSRFCDEAYEIPSQSHTFLTIKNLKTMLGCDENLLNLVLDSFKDGGTKKFFKVLKGHCFVHVKPILIKENANGQEKLIIQRYKTSNTYKPELICESEKRNMVLNNNPNLLKCVQNQPKKNLGVSDYVYKNNKYKTFMCVFCKKRYIREDLFEKHLLIHKIQNPSEHGPETYQTHGSHINLDNEVSVKEYFDCTHCSKKYSTKIDLAQHLALIKVSLFTCSTCGNNYHNSQSFDSHIKHCNKNKWKINLKKLCNKPKLDHFICSLCGKQYTKKNFFLDHLNFHRQSFKCSYCDRVFCKEDQLIDHKRKHLESKLDCSICGKVFPEAFKLSRHIKTHEVVICPICCKEFNKSRNLKSHLKIHTNPNHLECYKCGLVFEKKSQLFNHATIHITEEVKCIHCKETFKTLRQHNLHMQQFHVSKLSTLEL